MVQDGAGGGKRNRTAAGWGLGLEAACLALERASEKSKNSQFVLGLQVVMKDICQGRRIKCITQFVGFITFKYLDIWYVCLQMSFAPGPANVKGRPDVLATAELKTETIPNCCLWGMDGGERREGAFDFLC